MKAGLILTLAFVVVAASASAQTVQRTRRVTQEEVPVTIVQSLQKDFNVGNKGGWRVYYTENTANATVAAQFYVFTGKSDGKKIEIYYNPDGTVDHAKGVTVPEELTSKK
jgi:hypothetical protein